MKIDFHVHTNDSACSNLTLSKAIETAISKGISGIAVCNHNKRFDLDGISKELEERFNININPKFPCKSPFYIIPAIEKSSELGHLLELDFGEKLTVIAHPFEKTKKYLNRSNELRLRKSEFDIVECGSGRANYKNKSACDMAKKFAESIDYPVCAGSDAHFEHEIGNAWTELPDTFGLSSIRQSILSNNTKIFYKNEKRVTIAKSQILKNGYTFKSFSFLVYCYIRDIGDKLCQR